LISNLFALKGSMRREPDARAAQRKPDKVNLFDLRVIATTSVIVALESMARRGSIVAIAESFPVRKNFAIGANVSTRAVCFNGRTPLRSFYRVDDLLGNFGCHPHPETAKSGNGESSKEFQNHIGDLQTGCLCQVKFHKEPNNATQKTSTLH
jgi:hypothetical protein